jgi:hypothetical protein
VFEQAGLGQSVFDQSAHSRPDRVGAFNHEDQRAASPLDLFFQEVESGHEAAGHLQQRERFERAGGGAAEQPDAVARNARAHNPFHIGIVPTGSAVPMLGFTVPSLQLGVTLPAGGGS